MASTMHSLAARADGIGRSRLASLATADARAALLGFLTVAAVGSAHGGYSPTSWGWTAMVLGWLATLALAARPLVRLSWPEAVALAGAAAFAAWTLLSALWTESVPQTALLFERSLVYVAGIAAALLLVRSWSYRALVGGVWAGTAALCCYGLATRLFSGRFPGALTIAGNRLERPLGYWNSLGLLAAFGCILALGLAVHGRGAVWRALAAASLVPLAAALYFTFSRGAWLALALGLLVLVALDPRRRRVTAARTRRRPPGPPGIRPPFRARLLRSRGRRARRRLRRVRVAGAHREARLARLQRAAGRRPRRQPQRAADEPLGELADAALARRDRRLARASARRLRRGHLSAGVARAPKGRVPGDQRAQPLPRDARRARPRRSRVPARAARGAARRGRACARAAARADRGGRVRRIPRARGGRLGLAADRGRACCAADRCGAARGRACGRGRRARRDARPRGARAGDRRRRRRRGNRTRRQPCRRRERERDRARGLSARRASGAPRDRLGAVVVLRLGGARRRAVPAGRARRCARQ